MEHDETNLEVSGSDRLGGGLFGSLLGSLLGLFFGCGFGGCGFGLGFLSGSVGLSRTGYQRKNHNQRQKQGNDLFHFSDSS